MNPIRTLALLPLVALFTLHATAADPMSPPAGPYTALVSGAAGQAAPVTPAVTSACDTLCQSPVAEPAKQLGAQIFFRGGGGFLTNASRGGEVFTDAAGAGGFQNDGKAGYSFGFGFHLPLMKDPLLGNTVLGEVLMDYSRFSNKRVVTTTSALLGAPVVENVPVAQMVVAGSPKYRFDGLDRLRPWVIPVGMAMMVNSPPTDKTTYLDLGLQFGVGVDYRLTQSISLGVDCRYFYNLDRPHANWLVTGVYLGFDF